MNLTTRQCEYIEKQYIKYMTGKCTAEKVNQNLQKSFNVNIDFTPTIIKCKEMNKGSYQITWLFEEIEYKEESSNDGSEKEMKKYENGFMFFNYQSKPCQVEGYDEDRNRYLVRENSNNFLNMWTESDLDLIVSKQERIIAYLKKKEEFEPQEQAEQIENQRKYEDVNGFCDNLSPMQKGKVLKSLNLNVNYKGELVTRKDFCVSMIREGWQPEIMRNVKVYSKRAASGYTVKDVDYVLEKDGVTISVTKTEYDYAKHLLNNHKTA